MGGYFSNTVISAATLDFVLLPVLDTVTHVMSWLYSVVDVMDKCFDSMPRGPAGSSHGDFAEVEFTVNGSEASSDSHQLLQQHGVGLKIRNSLKLVKMGSIINNNAGVSCCCSVDHHCGNGKGDHVCAVCLGDIRKEEEVYELPQCNHIFHSACLDTWVGHNHSTCPLCRTSLITGSTHCIGAGTIMQQDDQPEVLLGEEEDSGFSLGIWFVSLYATNVSFDSPGWTYSVMRLVGF